MNEFYEKAIERLRDDKGLSGNKETAMAPAVREALEKFCEEAYRKAVQFYFPGAEIETTMRVRLCSDDAKPEGLLLKLDDFFGV